MGAGMSTRDLQREVKYYKSAVEVCWDEDETMFRLLSSNARELAAEMMRRTMRPLCKLQPPEPDAQIMDALWCAGADPTTLSWFHHMVTTCECPKTTTLVVADLCSTIDLHKTLVRTLATGRVQACLPALAAKTWFNAEAFLEQLPPDLPILILVLRLLLPETGARVPIPFRAVLKWVKRVQANQGGGLGDMTVQEREEVLVQAREALVGALKPAVETVAANVYALAEFRSAGLLVEAMNLVLRDYKGPIDFRVLLEAPNIEQDIPAIVRGLPRAWECVKDLPWHKIVLPVTSQLLELELMTGMPEDIASPFTPKFLLDRVLPPVLLMQSLTNQRGPVFPRNIRAMVRTRLEAALHDRSILFIPAEVMALVRADAPVG
jgi:hypothetical protein